MVKRGRFVWRVGEGKRPHRRVVAWPKSWIGSKTILRGMANGSRKSLIVDPLRVESLPFPCSRKYNCSHFQKVSNSITIC
jgi:hypothetical protein